MAPRQTARRLLVAAPALALALGVSACSPPSEQPAAPDAPYTLPTYTGEAGAGSSPEGDPADGDEEGLHREATTAAPTTPGQPVEGEQTPAEGGAAPATPAQPVS